MAENESMSDGDESIELQIDGTLDLHIFPPHEAKTLPIGRMISLIIPTSHCLVMENMRSRSKRQFLE